MNKIKINDKKTNVNNKKNNEKEKLDYKSLTVSQIESELNKETYK